MKKVLFVFVIAFFMALGMLYIFTQLTKPEMRLISTSGFIDTTSKRIDLSSTIIERISENHKLVCLEVDAEQSIDISKAFLDLDIFRQSKNITFYGKGTYTLDLSNLNSENILADRKKKTVNINIKRPILESINIDDSLTDIKQTENGFLRFGEYKITPEEYTNLLVQVEEQLKQKMSSDELLDKAYKSAERNIEKIVDDILFSTDEGKYSIIINYID